MTRQHKAELLKKRALDALLEMHADPEYATHQHHAEPPAYQKPMGEKGTELDSNRTNLVTIPPEDFKESAVVEPNPKLAPPESVEDATFFKESDPAMRPVEQEIKQHEFFKEAPEFEAVRASGRRPAFVAKKRGSDLVRETNNTLGKFGYRYTGINSNGIHRWSRGPSEYVLVDPASGRFAHYLDYKRDESGGVSELEDKIALYHNFERPVTAATKPKCPHCGSDDYGLMPMDFETAKCNSCGKNWDHGIVPGINDPSEKAANQSDKPISGGAGSREDKETEPHKYRGYADGSACYVCGEKRDNVIHPQEKTASEHGNTPDTGEYDEKHEAHVRIEASDWAQYAEKAETDDISGYDPSGKYFCGECDMRQGSDQCMRVEGPISFEKGSCRMFHLGEPENQPPMKKKFTKDEAKYGENVDGFSCGRCEYGAEAKAADSDDRKSWCSFWGIHVIPTACCSEWDKGDKEDKNFVKVENIDKHAYVQEFHERLKDALCQGKEATGKTLYHVTRTDTVPKIQKEGLLPMQTSNWVKGLDDERYGGGEVFAFDHPEDAVRWAAKMDWEFYQGMGSGKISIIVFNRGKEKWEVDQADPLSHATSKGKWFKTIGRVPAEQIVKAVPVTIDLTRAVVQGKSVKLAATKSYGMGQPLGGTPNQPSPEEIEDDDKVASDDERIAWKQAMAAMSVDFCSLDEASYKVASSDSVAWWAKSARPTEQKIELIQRQFGLKPEQIELAITADPSPNQSDYVAWIAKWMSKGQIQLPEDSDKIKQQLGLFQKLKKSPEFTQSKDIQQYDPGKLFEVLEQSGSAVSKKQQQRDIVSKGAKVVVQEGGMVIYKVTDPKALAQLSGGTNWCTARESMGESYLQNGPSYVFFEDGSAFAQFHPASNQLMNRQDVCMIERVQEESSKRGPWGRRKYETIASFITDPTALRGLQLLSAIEPEVKTWIEKNTSNPEELEKILGEKAKEEQESYRGWNYRQTTRVMTVRHALVSGKPLSPEEEEKLPERVSIDLLFKYGAKFHPGQRWMPLEKGILAEKGTSKNIISYVTKFLKARWPEGEAKLLKGALLKTWESSNMKLALEYAQRVIKGRWAELEAKFHRAKPSAASGYGSAQYAIDVLKQRWAAVPGIKPRRDGKINEEEIIIVGSPGSARTYADAFMPGQRWTEFEQSALAAGHLGALLDYTAQIVKGRMPELEQAILEGRRDKKTDRYSHDRDLPKEYAETIIKGRWPEYEQEILKFIKDEKPQHGGEYNPSRKERYGYAAYGLPEKAYHYIERLVNGRWPELEQVLLSRYVEHPENWNTNQTWLDGYLVELDAMCKKRRNPEAPETDEEEQPDENARWMELQNQGMAPQEALDYMREERPDGRTIRPFTKHTNDPQCYWPEGEQRLKSRDEGYESVLLRELKRRKKDWRDSDDEKEGAIYKGYYLTWYGNNEMQRYVGFIRANGLRWPLGEELVEKTEELEAKKFNRPMRQGELAFQSSLLKKGRVGIHQSPTMLPARQDCRRHVDEDVKDQARDGVYDGIMDGIHETVEDDRRIHGQGKPKQVPVNLPIHAAIAEGEVMKRGTDWKLYVFGPDGELQNRYFVQSKEQGVERADELFGPLSPQQENELLRVGAMDIWDGPALAAMVRLTMFEFKPGQKPYGFQRPSGGQPRISKKVGYGEDDRMDDLRNEEFMDRVWEAKQQAHEAFLQQDYLQQEAQERGITMEELWSEIGKEFTNEYFAADRP